VYVLAILITNCLLAGGYAQTSNAPTRPDTTNGQNASPKPSNSGESAAPDALPNSRNNPGNAMPMKAPDRMSPGAQRVTPVNPAVAGQNSPQSQAPIPQNVLFEFFFRHIANLNETADNDDKAGNHIQAAAWRTHDQRAARLNDAEGD